MRKKRNRHGNAKERYQAEYAEDRMFKSYTTCTYDFDGDIAKQNGYKSWQLRFVPSFERSFTFRGVQYFVIGR